MNESHRTETAPKSDGSANSGASATTTFTPRVDIVETDHELTLYADMPGVAPDQLDVRFNEGQLSLHGQVTPRQRNVQLLRKEYEVGDFHRVFTVGETIDASRITAEMKGGVLTLHLPKIEKAKPRKIEVRTA